MKNFILAFTVAAIAVSGTVMAQQINQPTGVDVKGCTFYKLVEGKVVCSPVWKEGYKASQKNGTWN